MYFNTGSVSPKVEYKKLFRENCDKYYRERYSYLRAQISKLRGQNLDKYTYHLKHHIVQLKLSTMRIGMMPYSQYNFIRASLFLV